MTFVLLGTEGCHLCNEAEKVVAVALNGRQIPVYLDDISASAEWIESYGLRIPVLINETSGDELDWPFTENAVIEFVEKTLQG
ncbi:MAG: glutaredoxin family protein [Oleibacter sp.]|nr:glutaredoxin family protein [Thalassolituus sp.]